MTEGFLEMPTLPSSFSDAPCIMMVHLKKILIVELLGQRYLLTSYEICSGGEYRLAS